jgi:hypothetical protein
MRSPVESTLADEGRAWIFAGAAGSPTMTGNEITRAALRAPRPAMTNADIL